VKASFIIPTLNAEKTIEGCLDSVLAQEPYEVIVVDSGSTDKTLDIVRKRNVRILLGPRRLRDRSKKVAAFNMGIKNVSGDIIAIVNQDVILAETWWQKIGRHYNDKGVLGVGGYCVHAGNDYNWVFNGELDAGYVEMLLGWAYSFRRSLAPDVGLFDEGIWEEVRNPTEDTEFCFRIRQKGKLFCDNDAIAVHIHPIEGFKILIRKFIDVGHGQAIAVSTDPGDEVLRRLSSRLFKQVLLVASFFGFWLKTYMFFSRFAKKYADVYRPKRRLAMLSFYKTICYWALTLSRFFFLLKCRLSPRVLLYQIQKNDWTRH